MLPLSPTANHRPGFRSAYIALTILLFTLLSFLLHLGGIAASGRLTGAALLPVWAYATVPLLGIAAGFPVGRKWWQWIYVEGRRWKRARE